MIITTRNQDIVAQAREAQHPTSADSIRHFVQHIPFGQIAAACPVTKELYGYSHIVIDTRGLARAWVRAGLGRGFDEAAHLAQVRIDNRMAQT